MELTPIQKLDLVLSTMINDSGTWPYVSDGALMTIIGKDKIGGLEIWQILNHLITDGYVYKELHLNDGRQVYDYYVTFSGKLFNQKGGYKEQERINSLNLQMQQAELRRRTRNDLLLVLGTIGATFVGALLLILELVKFFQSNPHIFCQHP